MVNRCFEMNGITPCTWLKQGQNSNRRCLVLLLNAKDYCLTHEHHQTEKSLNLAPPVYATLKSTIPDPPMLLADLETGAQTLLDMMDVHNRIIQHNRRVKGRIPITPAMAEVYRVQDHILDL
jgi:hypothetical protein